MEAVGIVLSHFHGLQLFQTCLLRNLILALVGVVLEVAHVGDVADVAHLVADMLQVAEQKVEGDGRPRMSKMCVAIDRWSADVHAHAALNNRLE